MHDRAIQPPRGGWRIAPARSARLDVLLFTGATAALVLHAAVDSFVAPDLGTAPGDHLLRGLESLAVLALAVALYPRLAAGRHLGGFQTRTGAEEQVIHFFDGALLGAG